MQVFIAGTGTNVGKTVVSAWLTLHLKAHYWKPIQSFKPSDESDYDTLKRLANLNDDRIISPCYSFKNPLSPHLAAKIENCNIDLDHINISQRSPLVVEGAGGVLVPINYDHMVIDLIKKFNIPVIIVAKSEIGTINHTCLTLEALRSRNLPVLGVIMNGPKNIDNKEAIEKYGNVKVLAMLEPFSKLDYESLEAIALPEAIKVML